MGIRYFAGFVRKSGILRNYELHDTKLIIDGNNVLHSLNENIDSSYGGEYDQYASRIKEFFLCLKECNVEPIVVFDGGSECPNSDRTILDDKLKKQLRRINKRMVDVKKLLCNPNKVDEMLPLNAFEMFRFMLAEMDVQFCQSDFECDDQIAGLAEYYQCPILSNDTDFYIHDLECGVIQPKNLNKTIFRKRVDGIETNCLECNIYFVNVFANHFQLNKENLRLFAVLASHDEFEYFRWSICADSNLENLISWINSNPHNIQQQVLQKLDINKREIARTVMENSRTSYKSDLRNINDVLNYKQRIKCHYLHNDNHSIEAMLNPHMTANCGAKLPKEFVIAFRSGHLPAFLLNVMTLHRQFLTPQTEEFENPSSYDCSKFIRQVIYGILLRHDTMDSDYDYHTHVCLKTVEEYDREGDQIKSNQVKFVDPVKTTAVPRLPNVYSMKIIDKQTFMATVLGVDMNFFEAVPEHLKVYLGCVVYWCKCFSQPPMNFVYALILCPEYFSLKEQRPNCRVLEEFERCPLESTRSPDQSVIYSFNQFQTCFLYINVLNLLMNKPFCTPKIYKLVSGVLLHNLTKQLHLDQYVETLLGQNSDILERFNVYKSKICLYLSQTNVSVKRKLEYDHGDIFNKKAHY